MTELGLGEAQDIKVRPGATAALESHTGAVSASFAEEAVHG